jgi:hypothetical protein
MSWAKKGMRPQLSESSNAQTITYLCIKYSFVSAGRRSILFLCTRLENRNEKGFNRLHHKTIDRCWEIEARAEYLKLRYLNPSVKRNASVRAVN